MEIKDILNAAEAVAEGKSIDIELPFDDGILSNLRDYLRKNRVYQSEVYRTLITWGLESAEQAEDATLEVYFRTLYGSRLATRENKPQDGREYLRQAKELAEDINDMNGFLGAYRAEIGILEHLKQHEDAKENYKKAYRLAREKGNQKYQARFLIDIGRMHTLLHNRRQAIRWYKIARQFAKEKDLHYSYLSAILSLGNDYGTMGNNCKAEDIFKEGLDYIPIIPPEERDERIGEWTVSMSYGISSMQHAQGKYYEALFTLKRAQQILEMQPEKYRQGLVFHMMANIHTELKQYEKALIYHQKVLELANSINNSALEIATHINMGEIYKDKGEWEKAKKIHEKYLPELPNIGQHHILVIAWVTMGDIYFESEEYQKAEESYQQSIKFAGKYIPVPGAYRGLGKIYLYRQEKEEAVQAFHKAMEGFRLANNLIETIRILQQLGNILSDDPDRYQDAVKHYEEASELARQLWEKYASQYEAMKEGDLNPDEREEYTRFFVEQYQELLVDNFKHVEGIMYTLQQVNEKLDTMRQELDQERDALEEKANQLEESYQNVTVLSKIGQEITATLDFENVLNIVYQKVNDLMDATTFGFGIYNTEKQEIEYQLFVEHSERLPIKTRKITDEHCLSVWCVRHQKEVVMNEFDEYQQYIPSARYIGSEKTQSVIYLPLMMENAVVGVLTVQSPLKNAYTSYHLDMLRTIGAYASIALANAKAYENVKN